MNYIHSGYQKAGLVSNDDLLYTLAMLAWLPVTFIERFEWRSLTQLELCAVGVFWKSLGDAMGLSYAVLPSGSPDDGDLRDSKGRWQDGLHFLRELRKWSEQYERKFMVPSAYNHKAAKETECILLYSVPKPFRKLGSHVLGAVMDDRLRRALLLRDPPKVVEVTVISILKLRRFILRYFCLPRFRPHYRVTQTPDAHGRYHRITWAAQPWYVKSSLSKRWRWQAWREWLAGRPIPGDEAVAPEGYTSESVGPARFRGKGLEEFRQEKERLMRMGRDGCPFGQ